jgi:hypothetical protein
MTVDRHGQDESIVVVGVLADEVDSARGNRNRRVRATSEGLRERVSCSKKQCWADHVSGLKAQGSGFRDSGEEANKNGESREGLPRLFPA